MTMMTGGRVMTRRCERTGKVVFSSRGEAEQRLAAIIANPDTEVIPQRVHNEPCVHCGGWHLTHQAQRIPPREECRRGRRNRR